MNATQLSLFDLLHTPPPEPPSIGKPAHQKKREREVRRAQKQKEDKR